MLKKIVYRKVNSMNTDYYVMTLFNQEHDVITRLTFAYIEQVEAFVHEFLSPEVTLVIE